MLVRCLFRHCYNLLYLLLEDPSAAAVFGSLILSTVMPPHYLYQLNLEFTAALLHIVDIVQTRKLVPGPVLQPTP
jgi:hypothetical protein